MAADEWETFAVEFLASMGGPADAEAIAAWERRRAEDERRSRLLQAEVPPVILADIDNPSLDVARHPIPAITRAIDAGQRMVLIAGTPGTGKTVAAVYVAQHFRGMCFLRVPDYLAMLQSYKTQWQAERATLRSALVLDELGEELDRYRPEVDQLLSGRYNVATHSVTLVTTNLSLPAFREAYGERIVSRFRDPRYCAIITCRDVLRPKRERGKP